MGVTKNYISSIIMFSDVRYQLLSFRPFLDRIRDF